MSHRAALLVDVTEDVTVTVDMDSQAMLDSILPLGCDETAVKYLSTDAVGSLCLAVAHALKLVVFILPSIIVAVSVKDWAVI